MAEPIEFAVLGQVDFSVRNSTYPTSPFCGQVAQYDLRGADFITDSRAEHAKFKAALRAAGPLWWVAEDAKRLETGEWCNSSLQGREATSKVLTTNCWKRG